MGQIESEEIGRYGYLKDGVQPCRVAVFPLFVTKQLKEWREEHERERRWFKPDVAAALVAEPELSALLLELEDILI